MKTQSSAGRILSSTAGIALVILVTGAAVALIAGQALMPPINESATNQPAQQGYPAPETSVPKATQDGKLPIATVTVDPATPQATPAKQDSQGWFIYENKLAGFSLSYPADGISGVASFETGITIVFNVKNAVAWQGMSLLVQDNPKKLDLTGYVEKYNQDFTPGTTPEPMANVMRSAKDVLVGKAQAIEVKFAGDCGDFVRFVPAGDKMIIISLARGDCMHGPDPRQESLDLFNKIMDTFTFIR